VIENRVEVAYARSELFERRRRLKSQSAAQSLKMTPTALIGVLHSGVIFCPTRTADRRRSRVCRAEETFKSIV